MRRKIAGLAALPFILSMTIFAGPAANADPVSCPDSQTETHERGNWYCANSGNGNETNSEDTNNPNTKKWGDRPN